MHGGRRSFRGVRPPCGVAPIMREGTPYYNASLRCLSGQVVISQSRKPKYPYSATLSTLQFFMDPRAYRSW
jgi:hypothetical protein